MKALSALAFALAVPSVLLAGCAGLSSVSTDVSSYGDWPAGRAPGTYAFDRLPSQQARGAETARLEATAVPALQHAGFVPAAAGSEPDVLVQVGSRVERSDLSAWDDPIWWRGGFGYWRHGPWPGPRWSISARYENQRYGSEVALLLRDRASGKPLFETHARYDSSFAPDNAVLTAMFEAALLDFPRTGVNPRNVVVQIPPGR